MRIHSIKNNLVCHTDSGSMEAQFEELLIDFSVEEEEDEASLQDFLQPLHETAERVSKQAEDFAKCLHKFRTQGSLDDDDSWEDARQLLQQFNSITVRRLNDTRTSQSRSPAASQDVDLQVQLSKLELECDLWLLASNLLLSRAPKAAESAQISQADRLKDLHRYSSNPDLWNAFLDCDTVAQEYETILVWLQERAAGDDEQLRTKIADTVEQSNRGEMNSAVPVFTSHAIKNKKRLLAHTGPLGPDHDGMASQLDPDASIRQNARLDAQDEFYENASWQTCWEMLRRGRGLNDTRTWWTDAKEPYRAALCGVSDVQSSTAFDSPFLRMMNLATNSQWLRLCKTVARDSSVADHMQRAAFGVLCGDSGVSDLACDEVDDMVFSSVNALLIERYLHFVSAYRKKLDNSTQTVYRPLPDDHKVLQDLVQSLQSNQDFRAEMQSPHKFVQTSLMSSDLEAFFCELGQAAAHIAKTTGRFSHLVMPGDNDEAAVSDCVKATASDPDSIRVIAHLQLALQAIHAIKVPVDPETEDERHIQALLENNIASYIGQLQEDKQWSLIPVYASRLSSTRCAPALGATLIDVTDEPERDRLVRLMRRFDISVPDAIFAIAVNASDPFKSLHQLQEGPMRVEAELITVRPPKSQTHIRAGFMGDDMSDEEDRAILGVEWNRYIDAENWGKACFSIATLYKLWLMKGRFSALRSLSQRVSLGTTSVAALSMNLNLGTDVEDEEPDTNLDREMDDGDEPSGIMSPRKRQERRAAHPLAATGTSRELLHHKSTVWMQLEQLVNALQALEEWQELADTADA
jgi:nuclear pore complex protein Nup107